MANVLLLCDPSASHPPADPTNRLAQFTPSHPVCRNRPDLNTLDTVAAVEKLVAFYVQEHNSRLPHAAFRGQTPDEMYSQTGDRNLELTIAHANAAV